MLCLLLPAIILDKLLKAGVDFQYQQGHPLAGVLDKNVARELRLPVIHAELFSEGGAWQTNGEGTMLLVESIVLDRNRVKKSCGPLTHLKHSLQRFKCR